MSEAAPLEVCHSQQVGLSSLLVKLRPAPARNVIPYYAGNQPTTFESAATTGGRDKVSMPKLDLAPGHARAQTRSLCNDSLVALEVVPVAAPASTRLEQLVELLRHASVKVRLNGQLNGSGFFLAPGVVLTCAHVTNGADGVVAVEWADQRFAAEVVHAEPAQVDTNPCPPPDLAVLRLTASAVPAHPCVVMDSEPPQLMDRVLVHGVGPAFQHSLQSETFEVTGQLWANGEEIVKLGMGQAIPGLSGSPVLNIRTGRVAGMVRTSRDTSSALGAWVVPAARIRRALDALMPPVNTEEQLDWLQVAEGWADLAADVLAPQHELPTPTPPSLLLKSEYGIVPFLGRADLIARVEAWRLQPGQVAAAVVTGRGGEGKTRLSLHLCERAAAQTGVIAGFVRKDVPAAALARLRAVSASILLVVDYAETREDELLRLLEAITAPGTNALRLLLLARSSREWLERLQSRSLDHAALLLESAPVWELMPLANSVDAREAAYTAAFQAFAAHVGATAPDAPPAPHDGHALTLAVAALTRVLDLVHPMPATAGASAGPSVRLLDHESRYWLGAAQAAHLPDLDPNLLADIVCAATLLGADVQAEAEYVVSAVPEIPDRYVRRYLDWLRGLYPSETGVWPLEPDRLGEDHIARRLSRRPEFLTTLLAGASTLQRERAWTVTARAAARHPAVPDAMSAAVRAEPDRYLGAAVSGAIAGGEPAIAIPLIEGSMPAISDAVILTEVEQRIPADTVVLADIALDLAQRAVSVATALPAADQALLLSRCAARLSALKHHIAAHDYTQQALAIRTQLAAADPQMEPLVATSLHEMGIRLARRGQTEAATQYARNAVAARRRLARDGTDASRRELAYALNSLGIRLAALDDNEEAVAAIQEAVDIKRGLREDALDIRQSSLALSLSNLSVRLAKVGQLAEALEAIEEAVALRRRLAARYPDTHLPGLATSLTNLGIRRAAFDPEVALEPIEEAVEIRAQLAYLAPKRYQAALAMSLNALSARLGELKRNDEALVAVDRALAIKREQPSESPEDRDSLATSLLQRAGRLQPLGRLAEALADVEEAIVIRRQLPDTARYRSGLARAEERRAGVVAAIASAHP